MTYKKRGFFEPKKLSTLRDDAKDYIGQELLWTYAGTMDEGENYAGQATYMAVTLGGQNARMGWVPEEDIRWAQAAETPMGEARRP